MEIIWTDRAIESYKAVIDYSLENFGKFATVDLTKNVEDAVAKISKFPSASPLVTSVSIDDNVFRYVTIKGPLQLVYKEDEECCTILTIWNTNMSPKKLLKVLKTK